MASELVADNHPPAASCPRTPFADAPATGDARSAARTPPTGLTGVAAGAFVDATYPRIYGWLYWLCGRRDLAADLTQETFAAFWASLVRRRVREPELWLFRIARNHWRRHCRAQRMRGPADGARIDGSGAAQAPSAALATPAESAALREERHALLSSVAELPPVYREAVVLRFWCNYSHVQIGRIVNAPAVLVRWRVHRACVMLRNNPRLQRGAT